MGDSVGCGVVGECVGTAVGSEVVGAGEGTCVGTEVVGVVVGSTVGDVGVGNVVGFVVVGPFEGASVGFDVVGTLVGMDDVGKLVGSGVNAMQTLVQPDCAMPVACVLKALSPSEFVTQPDGRPGFCTMSPSVIELIPKDCPKAC